MTKTAPETMDVVFSFDTTGSMHTCLAQVRKKVKETVGNLFEEIPNLRVDVIAHGPNDRQNTKKLDWRNELGLLLEAGIHVHAVQALGRSHATKFYEEVARATGGFHLELNQFADVNNLLTAICFKQAGQAD